MDIPENFFNREFRENIIIDYLGLSREEVKIKMQNATKNMANEWNYTNNQNKFYGKTYGYIFELENWHIDDKMKQSGMIAIASQSTGQKILEYGCGIGDTTVLAAIAGAKEAHGLDLPSKTLDYAKFRSKKFTALKNIKFIESSEDLDKLNLPKNYYDLVSAEDVFEHVSNPIEHAKKIFDTLKIGGSMYFSTEFIHSDVHPMHLKQNEQLHGANWLYELEKIGFKVTSPCQAIKK